MRVLTWLLRAFIFFTLFAFALNNQQQTTVHWFFGAQWQAPLVFVVLVAFGAGCAIGVMAMVPGWWRHRRAARLAAAPAPAPGRSAAAAPEPTTLTPASPPRELL
jgi:uncharacterized integral membrane protein